MKKFQENTQSDFQIFKGKKIKRESSNLSKNSYLQRAGWENLIMKGNPERKEESFGKSGAEWTICRLQI